MMMCGILHMCCVGKKEKNLQIMMLSFVLMENSPDLDLVLKLYYEDHICFVSS